MPVKPELSPDYTYPEKIVIGSRGSELALIQSNMVKDHIEALGKGIDVRIEVIRTSGDWKPEDGEVRLSALEGGKAQFAKEIEEALLGKKIDIAVHSMKDMETILPEGLEIPFMLPREDVRDAFLSNNVQKAYDLPQGSVVGTASVRREAFLLCARPDLKVVPFRGNVPTRIEKLRAGNVDATFLACAGLNRMGLSHEISSVVEVDDMIPAVGQGAVGIEIRSEDSQKMSFIVQFCCLKTYLCVECERSVLRALEGSCHTSVGVYAEYQKGNSMRLRVDVVAPDGSQKWSEDETLEIDNHEAAVNFGNKIGQALKKVVPSEILN